MGYNAVRTVRRMLPILPLLPLTMVSDTAMTQSLSSSGSVMTYCTYDTQPYTTCIDLENGDPFGLGVSIATTLETLSDSRGATFDFHCYPTRSDVIGALATGECDAAIGEFTEAFATTAGQTGNALSYPYHPTAYGIITLQRTKSPTIWGIFQPFTLGLWTLVLFTPLALAVMMTFFSWAISRYKRSKFSVGILPQYMFQNALAFVNEYTNVEYMDWHGRSSYMLILKFFLQSMLVSYAFLCLVVVSVYTAQLTNLILAKEILQDSETFMSVVKYTPRLVVPNELNQYFQVRYNLYPETWVQSNTSAFLTQLKRLQDGEIDGVVNLIEPILWAIANKNDGCVFEYNSNAIQLSSGLAFVWSGELDPNITRSRDRAIEEYVTRGIFETRADRFLGDFIVTTPSKRCVPQTPAIKVHDVAGAWVILAVCVGAPLVFTMSRYVFYLVKKCYGMYGSVFNIGSTPVSEPMSKEHTSSDQIYNELAQRRVFTDTSNDGSIGPSLASTSPRVSYGATSNGHPVRISDGTIGSTNAPETIDSYDAAHVERPRLYRRVDPTPVRVSDGTIGSTNAPETIDSYDAAHVERSRLYRRVDPTPVRVSDGTIDSYDAAHVERSRLYRRVDPTPPQPSQPPQPVKDDVVQYAANEALNQSLRGDASFRIDLSPFEHDVSITRTDTTSSPELHYRDSYSSDKTD